jgi:hypothetical protein
MVDQPSGTVTLVFTDVEGSTELLSELGQERYREVLAEHRSAVREAFARFQGYEVDHQGDSSSTRSRPLLRQCRPWELAEVVSLLRRERMRLVTLTGPAGRARPGSRCKLQPRSPRTTRTEPGDYRSLHSRRPTGSALHRRGPTAS